MLSFICIFLLPAPMTGTGERCHRRNNMTEQKSSACPAAAPAGISTADLEIDYFSQARKVLSERSPFDVIEEPSTSAAVEVTLPSGLASLLNRNGDNKKRQKKLNSGGGGDKKKKSSRANEKRGFNVWVETEEYFRDLNLNDIDTLLQAYTTTYSLVSNECFKIPHLDNGSRFSVVSSENEKKIFPLLNVVSNENENADEKNDVEEVNNENENGCLVIELSDFVELERALPNNDDKNYDDSENSVGLEWFLGSRDKVFLASERPSKKRKLLGGDAGLEKVKMNCPSDGDQPYCHYCGRGDSDTDSNRLVVCASCKVAVHRKCYGVQDDVDDSWLCSWCSKQKGDVDDSVNPCVLCSKKGGALKPVYSAVDGVGSSPFVHLYCCLWMPEVYIEDLKKMEPVMNVGGIKENRRKLMCNICKSRCGACVQCTHGSCRTPFHPLCAREARHRMEVWAKYGNDNIELRAFCSKHSDLQENRSILPLGGSIPVGSEFSEANDLPVKSEHSIKIGFSNGVLESDGNSDKLNHNDEPPNGGLSVGTISAQNMLVCGAAQPHNMGVAGRTNEKVDSSNSPSFALVLRKLIEKGKVDVKDVALETGISPDTLTANINEAHMAHDVQHKIVNWLKAHVYTGAFHKGSKAKFKSAIVSMDESGASAGSDTSPLSDSGLLDPVAVNVKSVPPRRRTINNIRILKDNKVICSSEGVTTSDGGGSIDKSLVCQPECENPGSSNKASVPDATDMNLTKSEDIFHEVQGNADDLYKSSLSVCVSEQNSTACLQNASMLSDPHIPAHSASEPPLPGFIKLEAISSYAHPYINKKLLQIRSGLPSENLMGLSGCRNSFVESSGANNCPSSENQQLICTDVSKPDPVKMEQLVRDEQMQLTEFYSEDELECDLIYFQHRLLQEAVAKKRLAENLVYNVAKSLPQEIDKTHQQRWDAVIASQYLRDLREAKKQGRKEKKHKEAQAVLAAATAAAASSTRVSSFRKDTIDESMQPENSLKLDALCGRTGPCSQPMPRAKETLSRVAVTRASSEKYSDFSLPRSDISKEQRKSCDICRRFENVLNPILVCSGCKVAVHSVCYRSVKETTGPWYCELCEDLLSRSSGPSAINSWEKPYFVAECALCGGTTGAFRKSSDGQWVHAFCAEWFFESTFRRGQIDAIEGMETVPKGVDICCICHRKHGVCMKCCYGHCLTTFHPSCARSAGLFIIMRTAGGKMQHKAYCEKHSSEQRAKAETQKHGVAVIPQLLKACDSHPFLPYVKSLHAESIKAGSDVDVFIGTAIVAAYAKCGIVCDARKVFDFMHERNVVTWNAMIGGYLRNGDAKSALLAFEEMPGKTRVSWSQMIGGFARNGDTLTARKFFDKVPYELKDVVIWTVMVDGYAKKGEMEDAREVFELMPERTYFVWSSMVCGYRKKGDVMEAEAIFRRILVRNLEIWNSMIAGYVQNGCGEKALEAFGEMGVDGFAPDEFTVVSVLSACAQLGDLDAGKQMHHMIECKGIAVNQFVLSGLIDMYAKCGDLVNARLVFKSCNERNVFCWNAMIAGFAVNGQCNEVLEYLDRMEESNIRPDAVTFITVLSACAHGGLVSEALEVISKMEEYGIEMGIRHYGCMVDLLGRAGRLKEAYELIKRMPMKPNETVLGAMIGACWIHSDMKMAKQVMKMIDADSAACVNSHNVLLSNIYAASEKWEKSEMIRSSMVDGGSEKIPGCSSIILSNSAVDSPSNVP